MSKSILLTILLMCLTAPSASADAMHSGSIVSEGYFNLPSPDLLEDLVKVTSADDINFGLRPDGKVIMWGEDAAGLIDIVDPEETYLDVSVGFLHVLLLHENGSIDAYSGPDTWFPLTPPEPNSGYTAVAAGSLHSVALRDDGSVESWGSFQDPVPEPNSGYIAVAAGSGTAYALRGEDGSIAVWGSNTHGQHDVPLPNSGFTAISAGDHFAVALRDDGSLEVWGRDNYGQQTLPTPNEDFIAISAGPLHAMALREGGAIEAWGDNREGQTDLPDLNFGFVEISAGFTHSVGVKFYGEMVAWGHRDHGACGVYPPNANFEGIDGDVAIWGSGNLYQYLTGEEPPNVPAPNSGFKKVQRRGTWTVALRRLGTIEAWGDNYSGQLNVPAPNTGFVDVSSGGLHSVALRDDGSIEAWGENGSGECDIPDPGATYLAVAAASQRSAAVKADGSVSVWGLNVMGPPPTETGYVDVAIGSFFTMALHEDGHIDVWSTWAPALAIPEPNEDFIAIDASYKTLVAQREDETMVAWGAYIWESEPLFDGSPYVWTFSTSLSTVYGVESQIPDPSPVALPEAPDGILLGALPNPFNPTLTVWFTAPADDRATIEVYDLQGRRVRDLWHGDLVAGQRRSAIWDGRDNSGSRVASGTYLVKLQADHGGTATRKVSLVK